MPRRKSSTKRKAVGDPRYNDYEVAKFVNLLMWNGKKSLSYSIFYDAMDIIKEKTNQEPLEVFKKALNNVKPKLEVRARRVGGANYQVPVEVPSFRSLALAIRWMVSSARKRKGKPMSGKLADEIMEAFKGEGPSIRKKVETHKMAESNRAFAHYRW
jgi:small subunit ribosomal protein S7